MRIEYDFRNGWTIQAETRDEQEHLKYLFDALKEKWAKTREISSEPLDDLSAIHQSNRSQTLDMVGKE